MRYYYKSNDGKGFLNLKTPLTENINDYTQITETEFYELIKPKEPTAEQKAKTEKLRQISEYKTKLHNTDYIVLKIAEAVAENDTTTVTELKTIYSVELQNRKLWREQINEIEKEL